MRLLLSLILALSAGSVVFAQQKPMPELTRVGVDANRQRPLALRDALSMALEHNKDIEVARENVRIESLICSAHRSFTIRESPRRRFTSELRVQWRVF